MTQRKTQDKYQAILDAAIEVFSSRGFWNTPTSLISKTAGIADGTLFTYFKTKDDLINEVYLATKRELADKLLAGIEAHDTVKDKMRHIWDRYIEWGVEQPTKFKVMHQISESFELDDRVKAAGIEPFSEMERWATERIASGEFRDYPVDYLGALMNSQAITTIHFVSMQPDRLAEYQRIGFDILWNGIIR
jgi:AcrR family transcriptional regulator